MILKSNPLVTDSEKIMKEVKIAKTVFYHFFSSVFKFKKPFYNSLTLTLPLNFKIKNPSGFEPIERLAMKNLQISQPRRDRDRERQH